MTKAYCFFKSSKFKAAVAGKRQAGKRKREKRHGRWGLKETKEKKCEKNKGIKRKGEIERKKERKCWKWRMIYD